MKSSPPCPQLAGFRINRSPNAYHAGNDVERAVSTLGAFCTQEQQMARRRFEMHHIRQTLLRMRQGDTVRDIAAAKIMGRRKAGELRSVATARALLTQRG